MSVQVNSVERIILGHLLNEFMENHTRALEFSKKPAMSRVCLLVSIKPKLSVVLYRLKILYI